MIVVNHGTDLQIVMQELLATFVYANENYASTPAWSCKHAGVRVEVKNFKLFQC